MNSPQPPRRAASRRRRTGIVLLLGVLLVGADTLLWRQGEQLLAERLGQLVGRAEAQGWHVVLSPARRGGWPTGASLTIPTLRLQSGGATWSGAGIVLSLSPFHPGTVTISADGPQRVAATVAGAPLLLRLSGTGARLRVPLSARAQGPIAIAADQLEIEAPDRVAIASLRATLRFNDAAEALTLVARDIVGPRGGDAGGFDRIADASLEASLIDPTAARASGRLLLREARLYWRDAEVTLSGDASVAADQPASGEFSLRLTGADALLHRLVVSHRLSPAAAASSRAVLGLIAASSDAAGGSRAIPPDVRPLTLPPLNLPISLHDRRFWLGRIPLPGLL